MNGMVAMQGKMLRDARKALKLNQTDFGELVGYGQQQISKIEGGKAEAPKVLLLACEALLERQRSSRPLQDPVTLSSAP